MIIDRFSFTDYEIPLRNPIHTTRGVIDARRGFLVAAITTDGEIGLGEAAILPEFGTEDSQQCRRALEQIADTVSGAEAPDNYRRFPEFCERLGLKLDHRPATEFALSCALGGLSVRLHRERNRLQRSGPHRFTVNGLVAGRGVDERVRSAIDLWDQGYRTLKIKIGSEPPDSDRHAVREIHGELSGREDKLRLRLDANCGLTFDAAEHLLRDFTYLGIEYVEDPLRLDDLPHLGELKQQTLMDFALDECFSIDDILADRPHWSDWSYLILKPARIGSLCRIEGVEFMARLHGLKPIYTSMFETSLGLSCILGCMPPNASTEHAHGLGTAALLASDTFDQPLIPKEGRLSVPDVSRLHESITGELREQLVDKP